MQIYPNQTDAIVLDGICPPTLCRYDTYDIDVNEVGLQVLQYCGNDPDCINYLGINPTESLVSLYKQLDEGTLSCLKYLKIPKENLQFYLALSSMIEDSRILIPAIIVRLLRCSTSDIQELSFSLFQKSVELEQDSKELQQVLGENILLSEMFYVVGTEIPSFEELEKISEKSFFATLGPPSLRQFLDDWDTYTPDEYYNQFAVSYSNPVLLLNGDLDPQTPLKWATTTANYFHHPNQLLLVVPFSPHFTLLSSRVDNSDFPCGMQLTSSFFLNNGSKIDTSCINHVIPIDFGGKSHLSTLVCKKTFNSTSLWGSG